MILTEYSIGKWLIDNPSGTIVHSETGERKRLGEFQLKLLCILVKEPGRIFTYDELKCLVWESRFIGNNSLPNAVHALRAALNDDGKHPKILKTVPRKGYFLVPEHCSCCEKMTDIREHQPGCHDDKSLICLSLPEKASVQKKRNLHAPSWIERLKMWGKSSTLLAMLIAFCSVFFIYSYASDSRIYVTDVHDSIRRSSDVRCIF